MSQTIRATCPAVTAVPPTALMELLENPRRFQLGAAILLLGQTTGVTDPLASGDFRCARVRIRSRWRRTPAISEIEDVRSRPDGGYEIVTGVLNIAGPLGVLPYPPIDAEATPSAYHELIDQHVHRLVATWYQAWYARYAAMDRALHLAQAPTELGSFASLFARKRTLVGLERLLSQLFQWNVQAEYRGGWAHVTTDSGSSRLLFHPRHCCRLTVGPVRRSCFELLLQGGAKLRQLLSSARAYAGRPTRFEVVLCLRSQDVRLAEVGNAARYDRGYCYAGPAPAKECRVLLSASECSLN